MDNSFNPCSIVIRLYRDTGLIDSHDSETALDSMDLVPNMRRIEKDLHKALLEVGYLMINESLWKSNDSQLPFDYLIDNNSTLDSLRENILYILNDKGLMIEPSLS